MGLPADRYPELKQAVDASRIWQIQRWVPQAKRDRAYYNGNQWLKPWPSDERDDTFDGLIGITQNEIANGINVKIHMLTYQEPSYNADTLGANIDPWVKNLIEERIKIDMRASGSWRAIQAAMYDKYIYGVGVTITGIMEQEGSDEDESAYDKQPEQGEPAGGSGVPGSDEDADPNANAASTVAFRTFTTRVSPFDLRVPIDTEWWNWQETPWIAREYTLGLDEARRIDYWKDAKDLGGNESSTNVADRDMGRLDPSDRRDARMENEPLVVCLEVWYRNLYCEKGYKDDVTGKRYPKGSYPVVITWVRERGDEPVCCRSWPYRFKNEVGTVLYPFDIVHNRVVPGEFWAQSDVQISKDQQDLINRGEAILLTKADQDARTKYYGRDNLLANDMASRAFEGRKIGVFIGLPDDAAEEPFGILPTSDTKPEITEMITLAREDMNRSTNVSDFSKGTTLPGDQTATAVNALVNLQEIGPASEEELMSKWVSSIAQKHYDLRRQFKLDIPPTPVVAQAPSPPGLPPNPEQDILKGDPYSASIPGEALPPVWITMTPQSSKKQDTMRQATVITNLLLTAFQLQLLATAANPAPQGQLNSRVLLELLVSASQIVKDPKEVFDVSEFPPPPPMMPGMPVPGGPPRPGSAGPGGGAPSPPLGQPGPPQQNMIGPPPQVGPQGLAQMTPPNSPQGVNALIEALSQRGMNPPPGGH